MKQYNYNLDFIKGIACICVVFMHCEFPGTLGVVVQSISRYCVPFFFMVSGYFCYQSVENPTGGGINSKWLFDKKVKHIFFITINASLFYLAFALFQSICFNDINWNVGIRQWINFLVFNEPFIIARQYWFLYALLYVYIIYAFIKRLNSYKLAYTVAFFMLFVYVFLAQGLHILGVYVPNMVYKNFLIEGFAFFMLGHWIHKNQAHLKFSNKYLLSIITLSTIFCLLERYMLGRDFGVNIMSIPQVFCIFLYAVNNPTRHKGVIQELGKRHSMYVYILHPFVWHSLEYIYEYYRMDNNTIALYCMPICVLLISLILSHIVYIVNEKNSFVKSSNYA